MHSGDDGHLQELFDEYHKARENALRVQERMRTATATATSAKNMITVVVGAQGELQKLTFNSRAYRDLPSAELAHVIVETVRNAREKVLREITDLFPEGLLGGLKADDLVRGQADLSGLLPESIGLGDMPFPGDGAGHGRR
jgi:DNA-binding protein YbaB